MVVSDAAFPLIKLVGWLRVYRHVFARVVGCAPAASGGASSEGLSRRVFFPAIIEFSFRRGVI